MVCTMEMTLTMSNEERRPLCRGCSLQLKLEVVGQWHQPGASIAPIALAHGINAKIVYRWLREHALGQLAVAATKNSGFIPLRLEASSHARSHGPAEPDICVGIRRGANA